ncbi:MAG: 16S rRNA (cytosine(1402)-N(4))-methyltransferase RsmH [Termitinemataceae bacterium]|nr:MAG: 16S rRNA (cytosine(1402)-N(4))-methyltransferase RsmH [Termitinemataceae bacterium]
MTIAHTPVLLAETLDLLAPASDHASDHAFMIDGTLGEGGHSEAFLTRFENLHICGVDADAKILEIAKERLKRFGSRFIFYNGWSEDYFAQIKNGRDGVGTPSSTIVQNADIILLDLGVSLYHYEKGDRGFSFLKDEALDMRIDTRSGCSAADLLNSLSEADLANMLYNNAEERSSRRIAKAILNARKGCKIESSAQLAAIVEGAFAGGRAGGNAHHRIHPATKTFAALRIAVNGELEKLESRLQLALEALAVNGKLGVISFHSLEDRIVKNFFKGKLPMNGKLPINRGESEYKIITKKCVQCSRQEALRNPPSRSAKLRVIQKII